MADALDEFEEEIYRYGAYLQRVQQTIDPQ